MKKLSLLAVCVIFMCTAAGCLRKDEKKREIPFEVAPTIEPFTVEEGTFDVDAVRSNIIIKGEHFDLPLPLADLSDSWVYRMYDRKDYGLKDGDGLAKLYFNGLEMCTVSLENCYPNRDDDSVICGISIMDSDCSIYGITPKVSTAADVEKLLGQPESVDSTEKPFVNMYHYGISLGEDENGILRGHTIAVSFDKSGVVNLVNITYSDLTQLQTEEETKAGSE